jgi:hypothetical protein
MMLTEFHVETANTLRLLLQILIKISEFTKIPCSHQCLTSSNANLCAIFYLEAHRQSSPDSIWDLAKLC